jgi:hypothetical protein
MAKPSAARQFDQLNQIRIDKRHGWAVSGDGVIRRLVMEDLSGMRSQGQYHALQHLPQRSGSRCVGCARYDPDYQKRWR